jgi:hypothetical protein
VEATVLLPLAFLALTKIGTGEPFVKPEREKDLEGIVVKVLPSVEYS